MSERTDRRGKRALRLSAALAAAFLALMPPTAAWSIETGDWPVIRARLKALGYAPEGERIGQTRRALHSFLAAEGLPELLSDSRDPTVLLSLMAAAADTSRARPELYVPYGFGEEPGLVRISRDGRFAAVASNRISNDTSVTMFDLQTGIEVAVLANVGTPFDLVPGRTEIAHAVFPSIHVVNVASGHNRVSVDMLSRTGSGYVSSLAPFPDGQTVAAVVDDKRSGEYLVGVVGLAEPAKWRLLHRVKYERALGHSRVAVSPSGRIIAFSGADQLMLFDVRTGKTIVKTALDAGDASPSDELQFTPDERTLAFAVGEGPRVVGGVDIRAAQVIWRKNVSAGQLIEDAAGRPLILTPEAIDPATGQPPVAGGPMAGLIDADIVAHGPGVALLSRHDGLSVVEPFTGRSQALANHSNRITAAFHDAAGKRLLVADGGDMRAVDLATGAITHVGGFASLGGAALAANSARFLDAGRLLVTGPKRVGLVDLASWRLLWDVEFNTAPDDMLLRLTELRVVGDELRVLHWPMFGPWRLAFATFDLSSGRRTASWNRVYDFAGPVAFPLQTAAFASDERILAVDADKRAHLVAVSDGSVVAAFRPQVRPEDVNPGDVKNTAQYREWFDASGYMLVPQPMASSGDVRLVAGDQRGYGRSLALTVDSRSGAVRARRSRLEALADEPVATSDGIVHLAGARSGFAFDSRQRVIVRVLPPLTSTALLVAEDETLDRVAVVSSGGGVQLSVRSSGQVLGTVFLARDNLALSMTAEGFFTGSEALWRSVGLRNRDQLRVLSPTRLIDLLRPDLVREKFLGDPRGAVARANAAFDFALLMRMDAAPLVAIAQATRSSPRSLKVAATITDGGLGIGRVEWRVDGVLVGRDEIREPVAEIRVEREVPVGRQSRNVTVAAYDRSTTLASVEASVPVPRSVDRSDARPRLFAIAVGVNDYADARLRLRFAAIDAQAVSSGLLRGGSGLYSDVVVRLVLDKDATARRIGEAFADVAGVIAPEDTFILFVAGHGITREGRYYFIPADFRFGSENSLDEQGIGRGHWEQWLSTIPATHSLMLFDTCESGTMTRDASAVLEQAGAARQLALAAGRAVLTASTDDAPAGEGLEGHGIFTHTLLQAFDKADGDRDQVVKLSELAGYVDRNLPAASERAFGFRQVPQISLAGQNFAVINQIAGAGFGPALTRDARPTHVVIAEAEATAAPGAGARGARLKPGTTVRLISVINGWALVARGGADVGYVAEATLRPFK
ncbi:caspase family protein [Ancylobacter sp. TS-1]|uniref:caspase family protein n=1 Tax=Ancylobacter sp. TS-1 TaxID=1850374 RepID=UPI001265C774|nr:caspase family protein [Ancylobacter sp. TS-1]QFR33417.1 hypothetical protein GBB76_09885 [Ancylobacter sp. TS-1]